MVEARILGLWFGAIEQSLQMKRDGIDSKSIYAAKLHKMIRVRVPQGASPKLQAPYAINVKPGIGGHDDYIEYALTFSTPTLHGLYVFIVRNLFGCCCAILPTTFCHNDESCNDEVGVKL